MKFVVNWYTFAVLVRLDQDKSGNPAYISVGLALEY
jgi:hypothetical protein